MPRAGERVGRTHRHGAAGEDHSGAHHGAVGEGLHERERQGGAAGDGRVRRDRRLVQREEREHAAGGEAVPERLAQARGEPLAVGGLGHHDRHDGRAAVPEGVASPRGRARRPRGPVTTSSHVPETRAGGSTESGFHVTRYRQRSTVACTPRDRCQEASDGSIVSSEARSASPATWSVPESASRSPRSTASQNAASAGPARLGAPGPSARRARSARAGRRRWGAGRRPPGREDAGPVDAEAVGVELAEGEEEAGEVALVAPERADHRRRRGRGLDGLLEGEGEDGVRAHLDEEAVAVGEQGADGRPRSGRAGGGFGTSRRRRARRRRCAPPVTVE